MTTNIFLRSTRRQPVKILCLALVIAFATFAFVGRVSEYLLIRRETERLAGYYRAIGTLEPMSRDPWADTGAAEELLAASPLVRTVNTSRRTTGILQADFCNGDTDLWGGAADRAGNILGSAGVNQYTPGYIAPSGFRDGYTLASTTDMTGYCAFYGTLTGWDRGVFHFYADEVLTGDRMYYFPFSAMQLFVDGNFDLEDPEGACAKLEKGGRYLALGYYSTYDSRCFVSGHPDFTPTGVVDVPTFTRFQLVPLAEDSYFIPIPEGGTIDWSDPALADMGKFIREVRNQQRSLDIVAAQDMSALPEVQETEPAIYLTAGRWMDSADDLEGRKTCVLNSHLASLRGLAVGDSITMTLRDTPSYFGYFYPFSRAEYDALEDAEAVADTYEIVGLYDYTGSFNSTAVRNTAYIPASALPETFACTTGETVDEDWYQLLMDSTANNASLPYPGQVSFVLEDPAAETEFFAQTREALSALGFRASMVDSGWADFQAAAEPMARSSLLNALLFSALLVLALCLAAFVYFRMRRREIAIARAQGLPVRRCVGEVSLPLLLIGLPGVLLGGCAGWRHTLENAGETLAGLAAFGGGEGAAELPVPAFAALLGTAFALLALLALGGAEVLAGRPVLAQLQGNTERKVRREPPVSEAVSVSELSFQALASAPAVPETPSWNPRQAIRFAWRHVVRAPVKSLLAGALAAEFTIALAALQLAIVDSQERIDWLYENTRVEAELFPAADRHVAVGSIRRDTIDAVMATGYVSELYLEMETTYSTAVLPYDRAWEAGQTTFLSAEGQTSTATLAFDDVDTFLSAAGSGGGVAITYHQGWDGSLFSRDWSGDPGALFPVILPKELYDQYGMTPGGTIGLICMGTVRPVTAAGYYEGAASGDRAYPVLLPGSAFRVIAEAIRGRFSYCKAHMVLDPARNRELDQFSDAVLSAAKAQGTLMIGLQTAIWDEELRQAVGPLENSAALMRVLYPVVMLLSVLAAAGIAVLYVMTSAREAAILRVQGTTRVRTIVMLSLQQVLPCAAGLLIGLTGILLYLGGTRPDLLAGLAPGTALCAGLYFAAGVAGAMASSAVVTGKNPLEMLQVKE